MFVNACKKDEFRVTGSSFVKSFSNDSDVAVINCLPMENGNFLIVGQDMNKSKPGYAVKLNDKGKVLWEKRLSAENSCIWKAFLVPGIGFATIGYPESSQKQMKICSYNADGQLLATKAINLVSSPTQFSTFDVLQLKNGNFVFAGCSIPDAPPFVYNGYLFITDPTSFNLLYNRVVKDLPNFSGRQFRGICELPENTIAFTATTTYLGTNVSDSGLINTILLRTRLNGTKLSEKLLIDTGYSVTPNVLLPYKDGMLSITGRMQGFNSGNGVVVNYVNNNSNGQLLSGSITLTTLDSVGQVLNRKSLTDYPENGMISSAKPTRDGGFILCGIVNQSNNPSVPSNTQIYLTKLDGNLNQQWTKIIQTPSASYCIDLFQTDDGGYFLGGYQKSLNNRFIMMAIKTDANGNTN